MPDPIQPVPTDVAAFAGYTQRAAADPLLIHSLAEYESAFGAAATALHDSIRAFFDNGGRTCWIASAARAALHDALARLAPLPVNLIAIPDAAALPLTDFGALAQAMLQQCADRQDRIALLDARLPIADFRAALGSQSLHYGAAYFPALNTGSRLLPASGFVAGALAAVPVWKAPANIALNGAIPPVNRLAPSDQNSGVNEIREFPGRGILIWGARTLDIANPDHRFINVRRLLIFIEQSLRAGLQQFAFEPNESPAWQLVRTLVSDFLQTLWREGALLGAKPEEAYFVKCGLGSTMTSDDIAAGRLIVQVGVAPLRPAEFVLVCLTQLTA